MRLVRTGSALNWACRPARSLGCWPGTACRGWLNWTRPDHRGGYPLLESERGSLRARSAGALVHVDVKKIGRVPDGGGWRARCAAARRQERAQKKLRIGYDYVHAAVDDHSRLAYAEILGDGRAPPPPASCCVLPPSSLSMASATSNK